MDLITKYTHRDVNGDPIDAVGVVIQMSAAQVYPEQPAGLVLLNVQVDGSQDASALSQAELAAGHPVVRRLAARSPTAGKKMCCLDAEASEPLQSTLDWLQNYLTTIVGIGS